MEQNGVCALIFRENNKILGVSRKNDPNDFGLVGGKIEPNESEIDALIREVKEETGLDVLTFKLLYKGFDGQRTCSCYICDVVGEIYTEEAGVVKDVTWETVFNGTFGEYNKQVYNQLKNINNE